MPRHARGELKQAGRELSALEDDFKNAAITQEQIVAEAERNLTWAREYRHQFDCRLTPQHPTCDPIPPEADVLVAQARRLLSDAQSGSALKLRELAINAAKERVRRLRVRSIELHDY
jgi:hypothetical protein